MCIIKVNKFLVSLLSDCSNWEDVFTIPPRPGQKASVTTVEALNATGVVKLIKIVHGT